MPDQSTSNKPQSPEDTGLFLQLKISESCVRTIVYLALALSVGSGFVMTQQTPIWSPQASDAVPQQR